MVQLITLYMKAHPEQHTGDSFSQTHAVGVEAQQPQQGSQEQPKGKDSKIKEVDKLKEKLHMK